MTVRTLTEPVSSNTTSSLSAHMRIAIDQMIDHLKNNLDKRRQLPESIITLGLLPPDTDHEQLELGLDYFHTRVSQVFIKEFRIIGEDKKTKNILKPSVQIYGQFVNGNNWLYERADKERERE